MMGQGLYRLGTVSFTDITGSEKTSLLFFIYGTTVTPQPISRWVEQAQVS